MNYYLAADFGGGSGRVMLGAIKNGCVHLEEINRFTNRQIILGDHIYWDFLALFEDMKNGSRMAAQRGYKISGIGLDTLCVDFRLLDKNGNLFRNLVRYLYSRTK